MDFNLTMEEKILQDTVQRYMKDKIVPIVDEEDQKGPMEKELAHKFLKDLVQFGYVGTLIPEEHDGPGLDHVGLGIIRLELGKAWASLESITGATSNTALEIYHCQSKNLMEKFLSPLLKTEKIGCIAVSEEEAGSDLSAVATTAEPDGDGYVINGKKTWVSNGSISDVVILAVKIVDGEADQSTIGQILVEREVSPYKASEIAKIGLKALPTSDLVFENCRVPKENLVTPPGKGLDRLNDALDVKRCDAALAAIGIAEAALEAATTYVSQREQFGKVIGKFQMIQQMIAEMATAIDAAKLLSFRALRMLDEGVPCRKEASMAKVFASEMAVDVASKAIQVHGSYGYSDEFPVERYFRDARCFPILEGTSQIQQLIVAREILRLSAIR